MANRHGVRIESGLRAGRDAIQPFSRPHALNIVCAPAPAWAFSESRAGHTDGIDEDGKRHGGYQQGRSHPGLGAGDVSHYDAQET